MNIRWWHLAALPGTPFTKAHGDDYKISSYSDYKISQMYNIDKVNYKSDAGDFFAITNDIRADLNFKKDRYYALNILHNTLAMMKGEPYEYFSNNYFFKAGQMWQNLVMKNRLEELRLLRD
jgi:hypothetical protein